MALWSKKWRMPLNLDKCRIMAFGNSPSPKHPYTIDGTQLEECTSTTLLGDSNQRPTMELIEAVTSKAFKFTRHLHSALLSPDPITVKHLHSALMIEYASVVCPPTTRRISPCWNASREELSSGGNFAAVATLPDWPLLDCRQ